MANLAAALHSAVASSSTDSSSASTSSSRYDVFLNHRGPDVKNTFVSHLYRALTRNGLKVFLDKEEMEKGEKIYSQIVDAIRGASVQIAIFSPKYAESSWCLDELVEMKDSGAEIIPVFHKVEPSLVRQADGNYAEALRILKGKATDSETGEKKPRHDPDTIQKWKNALSHVGNINGFEYWDKDDEGELCDEVVEQVLKMVPKAPLQVADHEIGLGEILKDFERAVLEGQQDEEPSEANVVGIVGVGGIGKTTLAKGFFNIKRSNYSRSSFLIEVRETARRNSLASLQSKLLKDLTGYDIKIVSPDEGKEVLRKRLSDCHALVILDDIDDKDQLDAVLPIKKILRPHSLILVTSRHRDVLRKSGLLESNIYSMKGMNIEHSKELFCCHAFHYRHPVLEFEDLVDQFVEACAGLPLSLKVLGALVYQEERSIWEDRLDDLKKTLPTDIHDRLKISYDSLEPNVKGTFLDIVCFFLKENRDKAIRIWGNVAVRTLEAKCLLESDSYNALRMHDHIRDMGRKIAEEGSMPRRLWDINIIDLFLQRPRSVRGIKMVSSSEDPFHYDDMRGFPSSSSWSSQISTSEILEMRQLSSQIRNLQLLATEEDDFDDLLKTAQPPNLRWLRWYRCFHTFLPDWIPRGNLRVLEMEGRNLKKLWPDRPQAVPPQLRELHICAPLLGIPKSIGQLKYLERMVISNYPNSVPLERLPEEFCYLRSLKYLIFKDFSSIVSLPDRFGDLTNLEKISLEGASSLQMIPKSFGNLNGLKHLSLEGASSLQMLPDSFRNLVSLETLIASRCKMLRSIPGLEQFTKIKTLNVDGCHEIRELPGVEHFISSESLDVSCEQLESLQRQGLWQLTKLRRLNVSGDGCCGIRELRGVEHLTSLQELSVGCEKLQSIQGLGQLTNLGLLWVSGCHEIRELPGVEHLASLERLHVSDCKKLQTIEGLGQLTKLSRLYVFGCHEIEELPGVEHLISLEHLNVQGCTKQGLGQMTKGLGHLTKLRTIVLSETEDMTGVKLTSLETEHLTSMEDLFIDGCKKLQSIQGLGQLANLRTLGVYGCREIQELLPGVEHVTSLTWLDVRDCEKLESIAGLGQLTELRHLQVYNCPEIRELQGVSHLTSLDRFYVGDCEKLQSIEGVGQLTKVRSLRLFRCPEIRELSVVEHVATLEILYVSCQKLQSIQGLGQLTKLRSLYVSGCSEIQEIPDVEHLTSLKTLYVRDCEKLQGIEGLGQLTQLRTLCVTGCCEIKKLTGVEKLTSLQTLSLAGCEKLQSIEGRGSPRSLKYYWYVDHMGMYILNAGTSQETLKSDLEDS